MYGGDGMGRWVKQTVFASTQTHQHRPRFMFCETKSLPKTNQIVTSPQDSEGVTRSCTVLLT